MTSITKKNILILGGAGFIGSHLCDALRKENKIVSIDNYLSGKEENHFSGVKYIKGFSGNISELAKNFSPDLIFHFGEYSRVETSFEDYDLLFKNNVLPFKEVLNFAKKNNSKLIYAGSSTKFASYDKHNILSPYAWFKVLNTEHLINYSNWFGLQFAIVYFYNVYGGNEIDEGKYSTVIGKFKKLYSEGKRKLPLVEPGTQKRNFTYYRDVIEALKLIALYGNGDGYGIGSSHSHSMKEVVSFFGCEPVYLPKRRGNRNDSKLIVSRTKKIGWKPKTNLKNHIKEFINH